MIAFWGAIVIFLDVQESQILVRGGRKKERITITCGDGINRVFASAMRNKCVRGPLIIPLEFRLLSTQSNILLISATIYYHGSKSHRRKGRQQDCPLRIGNPDIFRMPFPFQKPAARTIFSAAAKTGNGANAELAAGARAKDTIKHCHTIFGKVKCIARVAEAGVGSSSQLASGLYGFAIIVSEIFLARDRWEGWAHALVPSYDTIGSLSCMIVQLYQHAYRRQFKLTNRNYAALGTLRFAHLPSNSFLCLLPHANDGQAVNTFWDHVEISGAAQQIFDELRAENELLGRAVASLNTVRRRGQANVNILEIDENKEDDE
ncbi:hypothetical protein C8R45DRAFT_1069768 [Mycena sanguinolenta]|nr:hypothetical protein C8R45DRAFT_1069768 [Mycena sanguinolenta]